MRGILALLTVVALMMAGSLGGSPHQLAVAAAERRGIRKKLFLRE
jgi:hypothetical protein